MAGRFEDPAAPALDEVLPWLLTFRTRPTPVRLLARPDAEIRYVLVQRGGSAA